MAVIVNLSTNPTLSVSNTPATWFGPVGWARTTSAHASLPRSTAWAGATAGQPVTGRFDAIPGRYYVISGSVRAIAPQAATLGVDWRTGAGGFLSTTSGAGSDYGELDMAGSSTDRFAIIGQAPASSGRGDIVWNGVDAGGCEINAIMVREFTTLVDAEAAIEIDRLAANYADGDSPGGVWNGTTGLSTSTITRDEPASGLAEFGALSASGLGVRVSGNEATGVALFGALFASSGLIPSAQYDRGRGRIRVSAAGLDTRVVRVIVYSRPLGRGRWTVVRGGKVDAPAGVLARPIDDYEYQAGGGMEYRIDGLANLENQPEDIVQSAIARVSDTEERVWLKFIPAPWSNLPVELMVDDWELEQEARSTVHEVQGRTPPIVVSDVHASTRTSVRFKTYTDAELRALRQALGQGAPAYLQVPDSIPFPTMYVSIGKFLSRRWGGRNSRRYLTTVSVVEVDAPPPSVVPVGITWEVFADQHATWEDVPAEFDTWADVVG